MYTFTLTVMRAMTASRVWLHGRFESERGASAVEYALLVGLIAAVVAGAVLALGSHVTTIFNNTSGCISSPTSTGACGS